VVQLGRSLGLELIAEGVERPEQARALMTLGAMSAQGFLYARPMPAGELQFAPHLGIDPDGSPEPTAGAPSGS
jgi:EAL domain-containing protein (putative c-di-GMP-specific phosphodiesterase class I)